MREILFRGKRFDGIWQEGYYFARPILNRAFILCGEEQWEIEPSTVGQYTGLTDKNGVKIFDGDILKFNDMGIYPVWWDEDYNTVGSCWFSDFDPLYKYDRRKIEIIGNIHDNAELLKDETV